LNNNLLHVHYDPARVTPARMLKAVADKGFDGKVVPAAAGSP
jgi:hypothetical protein